MSQLKAPGLNGLSGRKTQGDFVTNYGPGLGGRFVRRHGRLVRVDDPSAALSCRLCYARMSALAPHLLSQHQMTGAEYRDRFGPVPLIDPVVAARTAAAVAQSKRRKLAKQSRYCRQCQKRLPQRAVRGRWRVYCSMRCVWATRRLPAETCVRCGDGVRYRPPNERRDHPRAYCRPCWWKAQGEQKRRWVTWRCKDCGREELRIRSRAEAETCRSCWCARDHHAVSVRAQ